MKPRGTSMTMPLSAADESARQIAQATRQLISVITEQTNVARAALDQRYGSKALRQRWNCSEERLVALLALHAGYVGGRGHRIDVGLDDVLKIDEALRREDEARKAQRRTFNGVVGGRVVA